MYHQMLVEDAKTVLLIDGAGYAERLSAPLARSTGARIITATDLTSALRAIEHDKPQAVISGLPLTDEVGLPLLFYVSVHHPGLPVVVLLDEASDDMVQQAQWYGATTSIARCADPGALSAHVSTALGMSSPYAIWDRVAEVAAKRHLSLVLPTPVSRFDADARVNGLFRGLGEVRGLRGTVALDEHGSALSVMDATGSLDVPGIVATLHGLIQASHAACTGAGLDEFETAVIRTGRETIVMSCCADASTHVHVVTLVAPDGNRALVELAHKRLQREFHEAQAVGGYPVTLASAAEISA
jgi:ActR/RegA family two-component response regulator